MEADTALHDAKRLAIDACRKALEASTAIRREGVERQAALARNRRILRWLQTEYPVALASKLLAWRQGLGLVEVKELKVTVQALLETQRCERYAAVPVLWEDDKALATGGVHVAMPGGKHFPVRCTTDFEWLLWADVG